MDISAEKIASLRFLISKSEAPYTEIIHCLRGNGWDHRTETTDHPEYAFVVEYLNQHTSGAVDFFLSDSRFREAFMDALEKSHRTEEQTVLEALVLPRLSLVDMVQQNVLWKHCSFDEGWLDVGFEEAAVRFFTAENTRFQWMGHNTNFEEVEIVGAKPFSSNQRPWDLQHFCTVGNCKVESSNLSRSRITDSTIQRLSLVDSNFSSFEGSNNDSWEMKFQNTLLKNCRIKGGEDYNSSYLECVLDGSSFWKTVIDNFSWSDCSLKTTGWVGVRFRGGLWKSCDIRNATFQNCTFDETVESIDCQWDGTVLRGCRTPNQLKRQIIAQGGRFQ